MSSEALQFKDRVYAAVADIPYGRAASYGDIASYCGQPRAARIVGQLAHFGPTELPWHRLVNRNGGLASGYYDGREGQKRMLELERVKVDDDFYIVEFQEVRWRPQT